LVVLAIGVSATCAALMPTDVTRAPSSPAAAVAKTQTNPTALATVYYLHPGQSCRCEPRPPLASTEKLPGLSFAAALGGLASHG
jgi:hypothetical protein